MIRTNCWVLQFRIFSILWTVLHLSLLDFQGRFITPSFCGIKPLYNSSDSFLFITPHEQTLQVHYLLPFPDHFEYCLQDNVCIRCSVLEQLAPQSNARAHLQGDAVYEKKARPERVGSAFLQTFWRTRGSLVSFSSWKWSMYLKNLNRNQSHLGLWQWLAMAHLKDNLNARWAKRKFLSLHQQ